jgi:TonB family protein
VITIKLVFVNIILLFTIVINAQSIDNVKTVNLSCYHKPLYYIVEKIRTQTGVDIIYGNDLVDRITINCAFNSFSVESALEKMLKPYNISFRIFDGKSFVLYKVKKPVKKQYKTLIVEQQNDSNEETLLLDSEPQLTTKKNPVYPLDAEKNKIEGSVSVKFIVTSEGNVRNILIEQSSGSPILDSATVAYAQTLKYIPAYFKDKPRNIWVSLRFKYYITNK